MDVLEHRRNYRALAARDRRFDGLFFVGVTTTGIYCRPICPARTPRANNCRFYTSPQAAEQAGFRPCLRCRPELAPGSAPVDDGQRIAHLIVQRLEDGQLDPDSGLERIADQFELSSRQLRRIVTTHLGVSPIQLLSTRRLLLAKQLLTDTRLPVTEVAFASGFSSLRRFNDAFARRYGMPPTRLRRRAAEPAGVAGTDPQTSTLRMAYRPPFDWDGLLEFLAARALSGVELIDGRHYLRTVQLGAARGWIRVGPSELRHTLQLEFSHALAPSLPSLLRRVRALFDLDARPDLIAAHLRRDPRLAAAVRRAPGQRVPGAFHGFELGLRAILGQQVTVRAATTIAGRFVDAFGEPLVTPYPGLRRLTPTPERVAEAAVDDIARLGIVSARARTILALAHAVVAGDLALDDHAHPDPDAAVARLSALPGIGPWTAHYIAMRALRWPDAFPKEDVAVRRGLGVATAAEAEALSQAWRPWRSYAVMHLWRMSAGLTAAPAAARASRATSRTA
jgi:AraC family transcriptional regulator, regulatory protein of adaptative response / DNA-3-methyladenine glycosylase II